ncbi:MAG: methylmalonyl-CoA mutase [Proteobacteria bacterium]|nr:methylmalonyl-CoA mutase [Desulfobacterales bacterium]MBL6968132.1 methylmalonyl-CoA mutase [Desulfobacteraceae bacterium]MBU0733507.1 methylmalonyl-CoA mutase [Pseudomonadota bacterium]MBU0989866.1 methylmalonyl-CoA mutase [Pseudomonadota bacterium]MBU1902910.1 methylmalonyl-CoA mutase [Pseudomonadota bacterium]
MFKQEVMKELKGIWDRYEEDLRRVLSKIPETDRKRVTSSGLAVKPLYSPGDVADIDFVKDISFPGQYPYTRGVFPAGYLTRGLHIRQVTGLGTAEETNERWKFLLSQGANALSVVPDDGSGHRADSDDERVRGLVGKGGVAIDTLYDYETLFDGIDMLKYPVHMITTNAFALACYLAIAEKRGIDFKELRGSMSNWMRPGIECLDIMEYCARNVPFFNAGYLDMRNVREGGCTAAQEIAFGVAIAMAGCDAMIERGFNIDDFLHRITWFVNSGPDFFEEAAKFRAMRKVWARIFRERYGAKNPNSLMCRMHCQTYAPTLTMQQPFNNLVRSTIYALAGVMGGVQSLHVNSFDEAFAIPTEFSASLSVRTQQIIELETGITKVVDPLGGSYYVEWLTARLEEEAVKIIDQVQSKGGGFKAWEWMCNEIRSAALKNQEEFDNGTRKLVGVNTLVEEDDIQMRALNALQDHADFDALFEYSDSVAEKQIARLNKVRQERDNDKLLVARTELVKALEAEKNMIPPLMEAVKCGMTRGEFAEVKAEVYKQPGEGPYVCSPPHVLA